LAQAITLFLVSNEKDTMTLLGCREILSYERLRSERTEEHIDKYNYRKLWLGREKAVEREK